MAKRGPPVDEATDCKRTKEEGLGASEASAPAIQLNPSDVVVALRKISTHVGNPAKFAKAANLAVQLLEAGQVSEVHAHSMFAVLDKAMENPSRSTEAAEREHYKKLFATVKERMKVFTDKQQLQIEIWLLSVELANELHTDDSFQFSRAATRIKSVVEALPLATEEEDRADESAMATSTSAQASTSMQDQHTQSVADAGAKVEEEPESDPFGLGSLLAPQPKQKKKDRSKEDAERAHKERLQMMRQRREALLACLTTAAGYYKVKWAQTVIDTLVKHAYDHIDRFTSPQRAALESLWASVREQMQRRKAGRPATGKLDVTEFEKFQSAYASEKMSIRKSVGGSGDRGTVTWLG